MKCREREIQRESEYCIALLYVLSFSPLLCAQGPTGISVPRVQTQGKRLFLSPFANEEGTAGVPHDARSPGLGPRVGLSGRRQML